MLARPIWASPSRKIRGSPEVGTRQESEFLCSKLKVQDSTFERLLFARHHTLRRNRRDWLGAGKRREYHAVMTTQRILVRGELSPWVHVGRVLGAIGVAAGVVIGAVFAPWGWIVAGGSGVVWLFLEMMAWQARRVRTWLTLHPDGMEVESPAGQRAIHDSQVSAVALETKKNLSNGDLASITRKFTIWAEDRSEPVRMENTIKTGKADPIAELIQRLLQRLRQRMEVELARGGTASGDGWHLSRSVLTVGRPPNDQQLPLSEVTAVETFDGQMCVWQRGKDLAVAKLPLAGRNVHLLPALVQPFLPEPSADSVAAESSVGLGRVLFERRSHKSTVLAVSIAGIAMTMIGGGLLVAIGRQPNADEGAFVAGIVLLLVGPVLGVVGLWLGFCSFRCHERGVWKATPLGQQTLRYADVGSFQYSAVRHYHNGAYVGTQLSMRFRPLTTDRGPTIKYSTRTKGDDDDLDELRNTISRAIGSRMAEQLRAGQPVAWTGNLQFLPNGLSYRPGGFLGRKEPQVLPYANYGGYDLKEGVLQVFARDNKKSLVTEQASAENFYPGFFLLLLLLHQTAEEEVS